MRSVFRLAYIAVLLMTCALPVHAWEPTGHTMITQHALQLVLAEMRPFYEANARYIAAFCTLPDDWRQTKTAEVGPNHFIDLDLLADPPFTSLIVDRATAEKRFGKEKLLKAGVLPWAIEETYNKLVKAMKAGDSVEIAVQSAVLAHYIGDAHVPLHDTKFYDGRTPDEKGIHFRWEQTLLLVALKPEMVNTREPAKVGPILRSAFGWCIDSYSKCDAIFKADDEARKLDPVMGYPYYKSMWDATGQMMISQLDHASERLAGAWIAAWQEAGKPKLSDKCALFFYR
jgi:hypothetical protein